MSSSDTSTVDHQATVENPHAQVCPDFSQAEFEDERQGLLAFGVPAEDTSRLLAAQWQTRHDALCQQWDALHPRPASPPMSHPPYSTPASTDAQQNDQDPARPGAPERVPNPTQTDARPPSPLNLTSVSVPRAQKGEIRVDHTKETPEVISHQVARIAQHRLREQKYVPLYYFTQRGRLEASEQGLSSASSDQIKFETTSDGTMRVNSASIPSPLKNVRPDQDLSLEEIHEASYKFLEAISLARWGPDAHKMWAEFFFRIDTHHTRTHPDGTAALALYVDRVRNQWHLELDSGEARPFDVSRINTEFLDSCFHEVWSQVVQKERREFASMMVSPQLNSTFHIP